MHAHSTRVSLAFDRPRRRPRRGTAAAALALLLGLITVLQADATGQTIADADRFGTYQRTIDSIEDPGGIAIAADGTVAVCEAAHHRIALLDDAGAKLRTIGAYGHGAGKFDRPTGIDFGTDGRLFIADTGNNRIQVFTRDGQFVAEWGRRGSEPGQFRRPAAVAVFGDRVAVADCGNHRVQIFTTQGKFERELGWYGRGEGEMIQPTDLAIDEEGRLFVADSANCRVQIFAADGSFVRAFGDHGPHVGLLGVPEGIDVRAGKVYVADTRNHRIQVFTPEGIVLYSWGLHVVRPREGEGKLHYPSRVAIAPTGSHAIVGETIENRLQYFGPGADERDSYLNPGISQSSSHFGSAAAAAGDLLAITEFDAAGMLVYDLRQETPIKVTDFGGYGIRLTEFLQPSGVAIDHPRNRVAVADAARRKVALYQLRREPGERLRYDPAMPQFVKSVDLDLIKPTISGPFEPGRVAMTADGRIYFCDVYGSRVIELSPALRVEREIGGYGSAPGEFREPVDVTLSADERRLFVVDRGNHRVQVFDTKTGAPVSSFGKRGDGDGEFLDPSGIVVAADGRIYVTDRVSHRVQCFDVRGAFRRQWGGKGLDAGKFFKPAQIVQDGRMRLLVIDLANHRGQVFTPDGDFITAFGSRLYARAAKLSAQK